MIVIVAAVVVLLLAAGHQAAEDGTSIRGALGGGPVPGGADGSPQSKAAYQGSLGRQGDSKALAHGIERAIGGVGAAAVCSYFGASSAAPVCAKVGSALGPTAVALGNFTTNKSIEYGVQKPISIVTAGVGKATSIGVSAASYGATFADRAYAGAGALPGPLSYVGKASVAPVKVVAAVGVKGAQVVQAGAGALSSGVKSAGSAVAGGVKKVLGFL
jgi:hypothetical protein